MKAATVLVAPATAQVNLLPAEIREARSLGVVKRWLLASVGVTVFAVGTVAGVAQVQTRVAASELSVADAETVQLLAQQGPYAEVTTVRDQLDTLTAARGYALDHEVLWADYLQALLAVTPPGVGISTFDYRGATPIAAAPPSTDPLVGTGVGTVAFTALAQDVPNTADWADAIDAVPGLSDARIDVVALDQSPAAALGYRISGTFQVSAAALSHRFDPEGDS